MNDLRTPDEARPDDERDAREVLGPVVFHAVEILGWVIERVWRLAVKVRR